MFTRIWRLLLSFFVTSPAYGEVPEDEDEEVEEEIAEEDDPAPVADAEEPEKEEDEPDPEEDAEEEPEAESTWDETSMKRELRKVRQESATRRRKQRALESAIEKMKSDAAEREREAELATMKEADRLKAERDDANERVKDLERESVEHTASIVYATKENAVLALAAGKGFIAPSDAVNLLSREFDTLEVTDGVIDEQRLADLLDELLEEKPYLKKAVEKPVKSETKKVVSQKSDVKVRRKSGQTDETDEELTKQIHDAIVEGSPKIWANWKQRRAHRRAQHTTPGVPFKTS